MTTTQLFFEKAAKTYDTFNDIQEDLFMALLTNIKQKQFNYIIDLGCGSGRLSYKLHNIFNPKTLIGLDNSKEMIKKAQKEYQKESIYFLHKDICEFPIEADSDFVFSNASFQWIEHLDHVFESMSLSKQRQIAFSVFLPGSFTELEQAINKALNLNVTLPATEFNPINYYEDLCARYFGSFTAKKLTLTKHFKSLSALLKWIKQVGIRGAGSSPSLNWSTGKIKAIEEAYINLFNDISVTFEVACFWSDLKQ
ncbi:MAG: hypothetical protein CMP39_03510 [Rickettsiales bacterium]|nr:hypothetical protein [Rickettsiales bacterium]|tara:strand:+ start:62 stop:820 length:759 start_codon:yes stop_codon:yes gene_type:complete